MKSKGTILVLVSAANSILLKEGGYHQTGIFLGEITEPLKEALKAGYDLVFASPDGKRPTIDKNSYNLIYWEFSKSNLRKAEDMYQTFLEMGLKKPIPFEYLADDESRLEKFDALFVPGGHAPMTDLLYKDAFNKDKEFNYSTTKLLSHFHKNKKPTALICHASSILAAGSKINGRWIYEGYKMTTFNRFFEWLTEDFPIIRQIKGHIVEYPSHVLKKAGAEVEINIIPSMPLVVEDRELLTGQDPFSAKLLGEKFAEKLNKYKEE
jgi:putative intracellular protease/amidase